MPSSLPQGYPSYLPRRSYRPASFYQYDGLSDFSDYAVDHEDLSYSPFEPTFPPRMDAETRYRRALHELEAAEQEFEAHVALERARHVALVRQRAAAEAARRERVHAIQAEVERIKRTRALKSLVEEGPLQPQHPFLPRTACGRGPCQGRAFVDADVAGYPVPQRRFPGCRRTRPQPSHCPFACQDNGSFTPGNLLEILAGVHPEPEATDPPQKPTPPTPSRPHGLAEPQPQPQPQAASPERSDGEFRLNDILEFFHSIASQARDAAGQYQATHEPSVPPRPQATPADEKLKGKAKAEPVPEPTLLQTLFRGRMNGAFEQEMRDIEQAIKLSLQDRDVADAKKAHASKSLRSSPGASSSKVNIEGPSSGRAASPARSATPISIPTPVVQRVSPLTAIRAVRTQFSALESAFRFPPVLDFNHSELAVSPNNAAVRAYEQALTGLLEQLDAIDSDGDEEVRDVRREVVREVERALEDVEQKVKEQAPQAPVPEVNGDDIGSEDPRVSATQDVLPADIVNVTKEVKPTLPDLVPIASPADADVDLAIIEESRLASPVTGPSEVIPAELDGATAPASPPADGGVSTVDAVDAEVAPAFGNASDSTVTITASTPAAPVPAPARRSPDPEAFLTSMSHDQFTFPPKPASQLSTAPSEDAVLVDDSSEGGSVRAADDGWSEVDA